MNPSTIFSHAQASVECNQTVTQRTSFVKISTSTPAANIVRDNAIPDRSVSQNIDAAAVEVRVFGTSGPVSKCEPINDCIR
jgi:prephenate dehydratase